LIGPGFFDFEFSDSPLAFESEDERMTPWGVAEWRKIAIGLPDWLTASAALNTARSQGICQ
jgi:hypothetical protein